ncbi:MAG: chromate resistance protein ChrB domain-containing protein [Gemmatimonadales bacterium]
MFAQEGHPPPEAKRARGDWLMLIHQLPPKPDYFRVKVRRRLQRLGAVALKNSVYLLPRRTETREDFEWLVREIRAEGGEATLCRGALLAGTSDEEVEAMFRNERETDYGAIQRDARALAERGEPTDDELARLRRRLEETERIDYFGAAGRADAERALADAARLPEPVPAASETGARAVRGTTWVTRAGIKVDRIASAWLIRRFLDPAAKFKFVPAKGYRPAAGELRFDMFQGEYTHEGDRCSFETLLVRFGLSDPALRALGEIVHDVDCKDAKFGRPEAPGIASLIAGLALAYPEDAERLERGAAVFEGLYAYISGGTGSRPEE